MLVSSLLRPISQVIGNFVTIFTAFAADSIPPSEFRSRVNHYTLYFVYLFVAKFGLAYISHVIFAIVSSRVTARLRHSYLCSMLGRSVTFHETSSSSGKVSIALSSHCNTIQSGLSHKFGLSLQSISTIISAFVVAFISQWKLTLVTATIIPAIVIGVGITSFFESRVEDSLNTTKADAATLAEEILGSVRTVLALRATNRVLDKFHAYVKDAKRLGRRMAPILGIQAGIYMFLMYAAYALAFWYGIRLFASGDANNSGNVITTLFSIIIGTNAFAQLSGYLGPLVRIAPAGNELIRAIDVEPETQNSRSKGVDQDRTLRQQNGIVPVVQYDADISFNNVSFSYPLRSNVTVLKDFSLCVPGGKLTALVGPSGSGKSTIVALLEKWYIAQTGTICVGQSNIDNILTENMRGTIGLVQQEPLLFSTTILENILYGLSPHIAAGLSDREKMNAVVDACKLANAHNFIQRLPNGYSTFVGNRATLLSGGQRQRLAIARAVISNPRILILDEATSSLDLVTEKVVQKALDSASKNRTTIAIAHRLSTIRHADQIVVLNAGSVVEQGNHDEMMSIENGWYRRMIHSQSLAVRNHSYSQMQTLTVRAGSLFPLQAYFYSTVVTAFQLTGSAVTHEGYFWALMFFVLSLVVGVAYFVIGAAGEFLGETTAQTYRRSYLTSMIKQPISFFDDSANSCGSLVSRLATDPDAIKSLAGPSLSVLIVVGVSLLSTVILSLAVGWKLGLVAIFGALPFIFFSGLVHETMEQKFEESISETFSESVAFASECIQGIRTVIVLNMETRIQTQFESLLDDRCVRARQHALKSMIWFSLSESIELHCMGLSFWYGGRLLASHEYSTGQFFVVFVAIVLGAQSSGQFFAHSLGTTDIIKGNIAYNAVWSLPLSEVEDNAKDVLDSAAEKVRSAPLIEFKNAVFAYPARQSQPILQDLCLKLERGQFIGIVGPSGCGRSIILGLLERFYDLNEGSLLFNGEEVSTVSKDGIRSKISLVSQEPVLLQGTVRENIFLGTDRKISDTELDIISEQAQILDLVRSLPEGYNTQVGSRGTALSGGQKQRIAIARAIAMDPELLLLDEATSALDTESETWVLEALKEAGRG
ncbi:P-loop containing nucleoside triphosphate hydrolase protein [Cadophora sp. DSE1049]|nr:P-loop containing nucleoside triphosphate hydrolase protein [Cadophora sp. DSE1049]